MAFNINEMRNQGLALGGARPSLFQVTLLDNPATDIARDVTKFVVQATSLPASTITPIEVPYFGRKIKLAGDRTFDAWQVQIMNDEDFKVRHALELWHNKINGVQSNLNTFANAAPSNYKRTAQVTQYGKGGDIIRQYQFNGIFPAEISTIDLDWNNTDVIETFSVTFAYDWFEVLPGKTGTIA